MTAIALASAKGSPGVTTLALALAATAPDRGDRKLLVVEADPDGGSLAARFALGYEPGLASVATAGRRGLDETTLLAHSQPLAGSVRIVPGPAGAQRARAAVLAIGERLADRIKRLETVDSFIDIGRASPLSPALSVAAAAEVCALVVRPRVDEVQHVAAALRLLEEAGCRTGLVCVGAKPYAPVEVAAHVGTELLGVVADDAVGASALTGGTSSGRALRRSLLWRSAADLSAALLTRFGSTTPLPMGDASSTEIVDGTVASGTTR